MAAPPAWHAARTAPPPALQLLIVYSSGYGQRPSLLDKLHAVQELDSGGSERQYHTNQMCVGRAPYPLPLACVWTCTHTRAHSHTRTHARAHAHAGW